MSMFLHKLKDNSEEHVTDFRCLKPLFLFVVDPLIVQPDGKRTNVA